MSLSPDFSADVTAYTVTTTNAQNKVTATPADNSATVEIAVGLTPVENGASAQWAAGENTLTVTVTNGTSSTTYTVTVTKE